MFDYKIRLLSFYEAGLRSFCTRSWLYLVQGLDVVQRDFLTLMPQATLVEDITSLYKIFHPSCT